MISLFNPLEPIPFEVEIDINAAHLSEGYEEMSKPRFSLFFRKRWRLGKTKEGQIWVGRTDGFQISMGLTGANYIKTRGNMNPRAVAEQIERRGSKLKIKGYVGFLPSQKTKFLILLTLCLTFGPVFLFSALWNSYQFGGAVEIESIAPILLGLSFLFGPILVRAALEREMRRTFSVVSGLFAIALEP
ncbi:MAG: hypothetical protein EP347_00180 [Alphaproteobacteria bacterium]|nr:MAG: hypothetical protein EP347_00180 [Alphaproteobacteria bacterium]